MKTFALSLVGAFAFFLSVGVASAGDKDLLQGKWICVSATRDGKDVAKEISEKLSVSVDADRITIHDGKSQKQEPSTFSLDSSADPKQIDITPSKVKAASIKGIYKIEGKQLKICWRQGGRDRPTSFDTTDGDGKIMFVLKQQ